MTEPRDDRTTEQVAAPSVSTAPSGGGTAPATAPATGRWRWSALPDHLGRAQTSTVILSVLFVAVFALYLSVRPDEVTTRTTPAGGGSDVEAPADPSPSEPAVPEPTEEPAPTTDPDGTDAPTTGSTPTTSSPRTTAPGTEPTSPTGTSEPAEPTGDTTEEDTPAPSSPAAP